MNQEGTVASREARALSRFAMLMCSAVKVTKNGFEQPLASASDQLPRQFRRNNGADVSCVVPSLQLHQKHSSCFLGTNKALLASAAALNLQRPRTVCQSDLAELPVSILWSLSKSFMSLMDS